MHILLILLILPNRVTLCGDSTMVFPTFVQGRVVVVPPRGQERILHVHRFNPGGFDWS